MKTIDVQIHTPYIKLSDLLKYSNIVTGGSEAKYLIINGNVKLNGEVVIQRGKKVYEDMIVECDYMNESYIINVKKCI